MRPLTGPGLLSSCTDCNDGCRVVQGPGGGWVGGGAGGRQGRGALSVSSCDTRAVQKNNFVSGRPAGWLKKKVRLETFFLIFAQKKKIHLKMDNIFNVKKKVEKRIAAARLASILATRWTGNRIIFMDSPILKTTPTFLS